VKANAVNVILNLTEVTGIDADGLEVLVLYYTQIRQRGGALKLTHLDIDYLSLNVLTKLDTGFEVFADEQDAVNNFFPGRATRHCDVLEWVREQEKTR